jgi:hypothetical protein
VLASGIEPGPLVVARNFDHQTTEAVQNTYKVGKIKKFCDSHEPHAIAFFYILSPKH